MDSKKIFHPPKGEEHHHKYQTIIEKKLDTSISSFNRFIHDQITASIFLCISVVVAMVWVSVESFSASYYALQNYVFGIKFGDLIFDTTVKHFVNDFLMTFFFFLLGLEIKKEYLAGDLSDPSIQKTVLVAAIGGVLVPALIFVGFSPDQYDIKGWGIPVATDTAFALGLLALFRNRVPKSLFSIVAALAVIDDLFAIMILALFYSSDIQILNLLLSSGLLFLLVIINLMGIRSYLPYLIVGIAIWYFIEHSGLHGTLAGVLVAMTIPARPKAGPKRFIGRVGTLTNKLDEKESEGNDTILEDAKKQEIVEEIESLAQQTAVPLTRLQHKIEPMVILLILPIFALVNAGIPVSLKDIAHAFEHELATSLMIALVLGKFIGISLSIWLVIKLKIGTLPYQVKFGHICGIALLAGIGFTMSIFIAELAFGDSQEIIYAKTGVFLGSFVSALLGMAYLYFYTKRAGIQTSDEL